MKLKICLSIVAPAVAISAAIWFVSRIPEGDNPAVILGHSLESQVDVPRNVEAILVRSCKDCHSNETRWPLYSRLPVVSDLIQEDVSRARSQMNFSEWNTTDSWSQDEERAALSGICEELRSGDMPLARYWRIHRDSRLTKAEVETVCAWTDRAGSSLSQHSDASVHR
jgi:cytochrome c